MYRKERWLMTINEIRHIVGMTQHAFASYFGIPVGTLRNWEQGIAKPPKYVFSMIFQSIRRDKMINIETIKFVRMLNELAEKSNNGIDEFSKATHETFQSKIFYAENRNNKIVLDACIIDQKECYHHDIVSFYESPEYVITARFDEDTYKPYLVVKFLYCDDEIVIEDGVWYFS